MPCVSDVLQEAMGGASQIRKESGVRAANREVLHGFSAEDVDIEAFIGTLSGHQASCTPLTCLTARTLTLDLKLAWFLELIRRGGVLKLVESHVTWLDFELLCSTSDSVLQDSSGPSGLEPVQLPSMQKPRDLRSWQPQVPRFDAQNLGETSSPSSKQLSVPFRSVARGGEAKLGDVRDWQPSVTRWEQGHEGGEAGQLGNHEENHSKPWKIE